MPPGGYPIAVKYIISCQTNAIVFLIFNEEDLNITKSDSNMLPV